MLLICWIVALALVSFITVGTLGYGFAVHKYQRFVPTSLTTAPLLGVGVLTTLSLFTGMAGQYNSFCQLALVSGGAWLFYVHRSNAKQWWSTVWNAPSDKWDKLWIVLPALYYLTRIFTAGLPSQHSDPLYYHLLAPKFWAQWGQVRITPEHPSFVQATLWELIFGMPMLWLESLKPLFSLKDNFATLVTSQITAQWLHVLWGQIGSLILGMALIRRFSKAAPLPLGPQIFIAWICTTLPALEWTGGLAKNDYILLLFLIAAVIEVYAGAIAAAGLFIGFAYATKMFAFWTALALLVLIPVKQWPKYIGFAAIAAFPVIFRNFIFTGNPIFPVLDEKIGPYWISGQWKQANETFAGAPRADSVMLLWLWNRGIEKALPKILLGLSIVGIVALWRRTKKFPLKREIAFTLIQIFLAMLILKPLADGRYASPIVVIFLLITMGSIIHLFKRKTLFILLPLGLLVRTPLEELVKTPYRFWLQPSYTYLDQFHAMQATHRWINENIRPEEKILFTYEKIHYYLNHDFESATEMKKWEDIFLTVKNPTDLFTATRAQGYRYLHFIVNPSGQPGFYYIKRELEEYKSRAVFLTSISMILDLQNLKEKK